MSRTLLGIAFLATACTAFLACDSDSTDPGKIGDLTGSLKFTYAGEGLNGTFDAKGTFSPGTPNATSVAFAIASNEDGQNVHGIFASAIKQSQGVFDDVWLLLSEQSVGTYQAGTDCVNVPGSVLCALVAVEFNVPLEGDDEGDDVFYLISGEVKVTSVSGKRLKGTFSGIGASDWGEGPGRLTISNGSFDVPILDPSDIPGLKSVSPSAVRPLAATRR